MSLIDTTEEIKRHNSSITGQLDPESIRSFLDDAENTYLIPAIGSTAFYGLVEGKADYVAGSKQMTALLALQKAAVNFAMFYYADNGALIIDDSGIAVLSSDKKRPASDKKLMSFKRQSFAGGFNALELAVSFFEANVSDFPDYEDSNERIENRSRFINSSREFPQKIPVSAALFYSLKAIVSKIEATLIENLLGDALFADLRGKFIDNTLSATEKGLLVKVRDVLGSVAIMQGITYKLVDVDSTGSYVHRDTVGGISGNVENRDPAEMDRIKNVLQQLLCDAEADKERLCKFLRDKASELTGYVTQEPVVVNDLTSNVYLM